MEDISAEIVGSVYNSILTSADAVSSGMAGLALGILGATVGIRLVRSLIEAIFEDGIMGAIEDAVHVVLVGGIVMVAINNAGAINGAVRGAVDEVMAVMSVGAGPTAGSDGEAMAKQIIGQTFETVHKMLDMAMRNSDAKGECGLTNMSGCMDVFQNLGTHLLASLLFVVALLMLLMFVAMMLVQLVTGAMMIAVGCGLLPLTLAFYPVIESWAKNTVGLIASGVAHLGLVSFLLGLVGNEANELVTKMYDNYNQATAAGAGAGTALQGQFGNVVGLLMMCTLIAVLGLSANRAIGFATSIFGSTSGMIGKFGRGGGGSKGGSGNGGGSKGGDSGRKDASARSALPGAPSGGAGGASGGGGPTPASVARAPIASSASAVLGPVAAAGAGAAASVGGAIRGGMGGQRGPEDAGMSRGGFTPRSAPSASAASEAPQSSGGAGGASGGGGSAMSYGSSANTVAPGPALQAGGMDKARMGGALVAGAAGAVRSGGAVASSGAGAVRSGGVMARAGGAVAAVKSGVQAAKSARAAVAAHPVSRAAATAYRGGAVVARTAVRAGGVLARPAMAMGRASS